MYKRQEYRKVLLKTVTKRARWEVAVVKRYIKRWISFIPVSYTHLNITIKTAVDAVLQKGVAFCGATPFLVKND